MAFVLDYEEVYQRTLSRQEALKRYAEYDPEWEYEKREFKQSRDFVRSGGKNPLSQASASSIKK